MAQASETGQARASTRDQDDEEEEPSPTQPDDDSEGQRSPVLSPQEQVRKIFKEMVDRAKRNELGLGTKEGRDRFFESGTLEQLFFGPQYRCVNDDTFLHFIAQDFET